MKRLAALIACVPLLQCAAVRAAVHSLPVAGALALTELALAVQLLLRLVLLRLLRTSALPRKLIRAQGFHC